MEGCDVVIDEKCCGMQSFCSRLYVFGEGGPVVVTISLYVYVQVKEVGREGS